MFIFHHKNDNHRKFKSCTIICNTRVDATVLVNIVYVSSRPRGLVLNVLVISALTHGQLSALTHGQLRTMKKIYCIASSVICPSTWSAGTLLVGPFYMVCRDSPGGTFYMVCRDSPGGTLLHGLQGLFWWNKQLVSYSYLSQR